MKNFILQSLISLLLLPAFLQWLPHDLMHALHDQHISHQKKGNLAGEIHTHNSAPHDHKTHARKSAHHVINLDAPTYFSEYLHVDLQSPGQLVFKGLVQTASAIDFILADDRLTHQQLRLASPQNRGPPPDYGWRTLRPNTPLYLTTQRLRI